PLLPGRKMYPVESGRAKGSRPVEPDPHEVALVCLEKSRAGKRLDSRAEHHELRLDPGHVGRSHEHLDYGREQSPLMFRRGAVPPHVKVADQALVLIMDAIRVAKNRAVIGKR